jgi:hypothetical protein
MIVYSVINRSVGQVKGDDPGKKGYPSPGVGNLFMLEGRINLAVIK